MSSELQSSSNDEKHLRVDTIYWSGKSGRYSPLSLSLPEAEGTELENEVDIIYSVDAVEGEVTSRIFQ